MDEEANRIANGSMRAQHVPLALQKVMGVTSFSNASLSVCTETGHIAYAAGSVVVIYNPKTDQQVKFFRTARAISCLAFDAAGKFLAVGEKGHAPVISLFEVSQSDSAEASSQFSGHRNGIGALKFSPNGEYLVSAGFKHDKQLILWSLKENKPVALGKLSNKVNSIAFAPDSSYLITCGDRHLKWWYIQQEGSKIDISGKPASILEVLRNAIFTDVVIGQGKFASSIYCTTASGALCVFHDTRIMDRWAQLECDSSYSMSMVDEKIIVGCSNGKVQVIDPNSLSSISTVPNPTALPYTEMDEHAAITTSYSSTSYPACYGIQFIPATSTDKDTPLRAVALYADRSIYIWDIGKARVSSSSSSNESALDIKKYRSSLYHRACVWDIVFIPQSQAQSITTQQGRQKALPAGTFVTCSADNTLRFWNTGDASSAVTQSNGNPVWKSAHSRELLHTIHLDVPTKNLGGTQAVRSSGESLIYTSIQEIGHNPSSQTLSCGLPDTEIPDRPDSSGAPRSLAVHPSSQALAVGDRAGRVRIFQLATMTQAQCINAHDAEVLTLQYSKTKNPPLGSAINAPILGSSLLASAGRDRLVHIFDAPEPAEDYKLLTTLDNHSSSVTAMSFTNDSRRLVTCGGDKTMVFSSINGNEVTRLKSVQTSNGTISGLTVDATNKFAVTSGQDKKVHIWNVASGKHVRAYRQESWGELYKCDIDPSGMFIATCGFDKIVRILDFFSGEVVIEVGAHSELVTGIKFSPDGKFLITVGGDGCILQWRLGGLLRSAMKERMLELYAVAKRKQERANDAVVLPLPPPPPPASTNVPSSDSSVEADRGPEISPPPPPAPATAPEQNLPVKSARNRWQARIKDQGGYEIFGKKVAVNTIMSASVDGFLTGTPKASDTAPSGVRASVGVGAGKKLNNFTLEVGTCNISRNASTASRTNDLANTVEAQDDVQLGDVKFDVANDDGDNRLDDDSDVYADDFDSDVPQDEKTPKNDDEDLQRASINLEKLERQSLALESWLEEKLKNESVMDSVSVSAKLDTHDNQADLSPPARVANDAGDNINVSISSTDASADNSTAEEATDVDVKVTASKPSAPPPSAQPTARSPKPSMAPPSADDGSKHNELGKSITSTFFKALISQAPGENMPPPPPTIEVENYVEGKEAEDIDLDDVESDDDESVNDGGSSSSSSSSSSTKPAIAAEDTTAIASATDEAVVTEAPTSNVGSVKQVKVAAKLEQMRDKLAAMGILAGDRGPTPDMEDQDTDEEEEAPTNTKDEPKSNEDGGNDTEDEEDSKENKILNRPDDLKYEGTLSAFPSDGTMLAALQADSTDRTVANLNIPSDTILAAGLADGEVEVEDTSKQPQQHVKVVDKELPERMMTESISSDGGMLAMKKKTEECRRIMSELSTMTSKAARAFSDLNNLRSSVSQSISMTQPSTAASSSSPLKSAVDKSMVYDNPEVDSLFSDFRSSISTLVNLASMIEKDTSFSIDGLTNETSEIDRSTVMDTTSTDSAAGTIHSGSRGNGDHNTSTTATMLSTSTQQPPPDADAMKVLESYSDMMAEMVAQKMMKKMESTSTSD